jgi:hypothetical protein
LRDVYLHVKIRYTGAKIAAQIRGSRHAVTCVFLCGAGACCWLWLWLPIEQRGSEPMLSQSGRNEATPLAFDAFLVVATAHTCRHTVLCLSACLWCWCMLYVRTYVRTTRLCLCARSPLSFLFLFPWPLGGRSFALRCVALPYPSLAFPLHPPIIDHACSGSSAGGWLVGLPAGCCMR